MTEVADLYVVLRSVGAQFERGMARAGASAAEADGRIAGMAGGIKMMSIAAVGAGLVVAGAAVKMSTEFDRLMEQLHTLAHVPQQDLKELATGVMNVAGAVGYSPNSLAQALYHIESTFASVGITSQKALTVLATAAKGAQIGGADLVDVVNALDAAVVSGIPGAQNLNQAMGALLATVGAGDMTMQNLADALGTGILALVKQFGVTLADTGAALATFGDNNIRGSKAATDLRMVIMDLAKQSKEGQKQLAKLGLTSGQLGRDMQSGGLNKAILDLRAHLAAAGITGKAVGSVLADIFTKRSAAPLAILLGEIGQFESKYPELKKGADSFGDSWAKTSALISTRAKMAKANIEDAFIGLGHALAPIASGILNMFNKAFEWARTHKKTMEEIGRVIKVFLVGALVIAAGVLAEMAVEAAIAAAPFILLAGAVGLLVKWLVNLYEHNAKVRAFVKTIVDGFKKDATIAVHWLMGAFQTAKRVIGEVINAIVGFYEKHQQQINRMVGDVVTVMRDVWSAFKAGFDAVKAVVMTVVKIVEDLWARFGEHLWQHVVTAWHAIVQVVRGALEFIHGLFDMIAGLLTGHWSRFWKGIKEVVGGTWNMISGIVKEGVNAISTVIGAAVAVISAVWDFAWHAISTAAKAAWDFISGVFAPVGDFFSSIGDGIVTAWGAVVSFFEGLPGHIASLLSRAGTWLVNIGKEAIEGLLHGLWLATVGVYRWVVSNGGLLGLGIKAMQALHEGIVTAWDAVIRFFEDIPGWILTAMKDAGYWLITTGHSIILGIWHGMENAWGAVARFFSNIPGWIWHLLSAAGTWLINVGHDVIWGMWHGIMTSMGMIWGWAKGLPQDIFNIVDEVYNWMISVGSNIVIGLWNGIVKMAEWLWNKVKNWCSDLYNGILSFFGINSPSRLMRDNVGKHIATGIAAGILDNKHHVKAALESLGNDVANTRFTIGGVRLGSSVLGASGALSGGSGAVGSGSPVYNIQVQGSVIDTQGLFKAVQTAAQRHGARNPRSAGLVFLK